MGGQACVMYGGAEFSRDTDIAFLASEENISLLRSALQDLHAKRIALPPFDIQFLIRGHAIHFRSYHPDALHIRLDVMSVMRGVDDFGQLWSRRAIVPTDDGVPLNILSLPDLVRAKKTQRDKDWPMIRRLIESDYIRQSKPTVEQVKFWCMESRTPEMLLELSHAYREQCEQLKPARKVLEYVYTHQTDEVEAELLREEMKERAADRRYWEPLRKELEDLRHSPYLAEEEV